jgi:hypothetical protein
MAQRRMFSKEVVRSEEFLEMPSDAQTLYFHLGIDADDDGFVQPAQVMRITGAKIDSLKVLEAKGFIIQIDGERVIIITHWKMNNFIKKDRYKASIYLGLLNKYSIKLINFNDNLKYIRCTPSDSEMTPGCTPSDSVV